MDNIEYLAQAPVNSYVTFGNVIAIFLAELTVFILVIGIMTLWITGQLNSATEQRNNISTSAAEQRNQIANQLAKTQRQLNNLTILVATEKGLTVEEAIRLIKETEKD